jgi:uroporphyrinogen-III decarboxylase
MKAQKTPLQYFISELKKSKDFQRVINDVNQQNTFVTDVIKKAQDIEKQHLEMAFNAGADSEAGNTILTFEKYYLKIYKFKPIKKQWLP